MGDHFQSDIRGSFPGRARVNRLIKLNIKLNMQNVCDFSMLYFKKNCGFFFLQSIDQEILFGKIPPTREYNSIKTIQASKM